MPRSGTLGNPQLYTPFGVFAGLPFWGGGPSLLAAAPGIGKTSWLLRIIYESAALHIPSTIGCYEHTPEELHFRLFLQTRQYVNQQTASRKTENVQPKQKIKTEYPVRERPTIENNVPDYSAPSVIHPIDLA
jgi:hypothetical protein